MTPAVTVTLPLVHVRAVCHDCRRKHDYRVEREHLVAAYGEWSTKHPGHAVAYSLPRPVYDGPWKKRLHDFWNDVRVFAPGWFPLGFGYGHNADIKVSYVASAAYTITLASLATSSTRTAGQESDGISNTSNYLDYLIGGKITTGTSPTAGRQIDIWAGCAVNDTPLYPDVLDGTNSAETITSENVRNSALVPLRSLTVDSTSDRTYWCAPTSLAQAQGGFAPIKAHVLFVAHDTAVNLNSTGSNQAMYYTGLYGTVA